MNCDRQWNNEYEEEICYREQHVEYNLFNVRLQRTYRNRFQLSVLNELKRRAICSILTEACVRIHFCLIRSLNVHLMFLI